LVQFSWPGPKLDGNKRIIKQPLLMTRRNTGTHSSSLKPKKVLEATIHGTSYVQRVMPIGTAGWKC
jgi:hypothetical protein